MILLFSFFYLAKNVISSRRLLLFEIYSMKKLEPEKKEYFRKFLDDCYIPGIIHLLNNIFIRLDHVRVPREDYEYLYNAPYRKVK